MPVRSVSIKHLRVNVYVCVFPGVVLFSIQHTPWPSPPQVSHYVKSLFMRLIPIFTHAQTFLFTNLLLSVGVQHRRRKRREKIGTQSTTTRQVFMFFLVSNHKKIIHLPFILKECRFSFKAHNFTLSLWRVPKIHEKVYILI